jgi:hypothetical protein
MDRAADYAIQGFLYQFNKTLLEVLKSGDGAEISIEGVIEDIEVKAPEGVKAIQCKYHETKDEFVLSTIYKPLLQMMQHYHANQQASITYTLFAHFPNPPVGKNLTAAELEEAINSGNKGVKKYCDALKGKVDIAKFLARFVLDFGASFDVLVSEVHTALKANGVPEEDIECLAYPNAIQIVANLSIKHDATQRRIVKTQLLADLKKIKTTAISRWTLALKTRKQLLDARKKQLKPHLGINARLRYFVVNAASLDDFDAEIVGFICDFLNKYHFKTAHISTPLLCLDAPEAVFRDIQIRLHRKGVKVTDGFVGTVFDEPEFFRAPLSVKDTTTGNPRREFALRLLRWEQHGPILGNQKPDDLFVLGTSRYDGLDTKDVNVELLDASGLKAISYLIGVSNACE